MALTAPRLIRRLLFGFLLGVVAIILIDQSFLLRDIVIAFFDRVTAGPPSCAPISASEAIRVIHAEMPEIVKCVDLDQPKPFPETVKMVAEFPSKALGGRFGGWQRWAVVWVSCHLGAGVRGEHLVIVSRTGRHYRLEEIRSETASSSMQEVYPLKPIHSAFCEYPMIGLCSAWSSGNNSGNDTTVLMFRAPSVFRRLLYRWKTLRVVLTVESRETRGPVSPYSSREAALLTADVRRGTANRILVRIETGDGSETGGGVEYEAFEWDAFHQKYVSKGSAVPETGDAAQRDDLLEPARHLSVREIALALHAASDLCRDPDTRIRKDHAGEWALIWCQEVFLSVCRMKNPDDLEQDSALKRRLESEIASGSPDAPVLEYVAGNVLVVVRGPGYLGGIKESMAKVLPGGEWVRKF